MDELQRIWKRHQYVARASTAFIYGILVSIAMNFFGHQVRFILPESPVWRSY